MFCKRLRRPFVFVDRPHEIIHFSKIILSVLLIAYACLLYRKLGQLEYIKEKLSGQDGHFTVIRPKCLIEAPLVSVVMSVYNNEKHLQEALDSILNQTHKNFYTTPGNCQKAFGQN